MSNHHTHESHTHNFLNRHTAPAILILIVGCFLAGYFVGSHRDYYKIGSVGVDLSSDATVGQN